MFGGFQDRTPALRAERVSHPGEHLPDDSSNRLLAALPLEARRRLIQRGTRVSLKRRQIILDHNLPVRYAYFIERGAASFVLKVAGRSVEIRTVGTWDLVGIPIVLGTYQSHHRCIVQIAGEALLVPARDLIELMDELPELRRLLLRYVQYALVHSSQLTACNILHRLQQRLAGWLLLASNQLESNEIDLTHESLSKALGVRRASVTDTIGKFEKAGLVGCERGRINVIDHAALERTSCDCHRVIRAAQSRSISTAHHVPNHCNTTRDDLKNAQAFHFADVDKANAGAGMTTGNASATTGRTRVDRLLPKVKSAN